MAVDAADRSPTPKETGLGAAVLQAVDKAVVARWERAKRVAAGTAGTEAERIDTLRRRFVREAGTAGAAVGGVSNYALANQIARQAEEFFADA